MNAATLIGRTRLRRRWWPIVRLGVVAGLVLGSVLSVAALARRTDTAYDRLARATDLEDVRVSSFTGQAATDAVAGLAGIEQAQTEDVFVGRPAGDAVTFLSVTAPRSADPERLSRPLVVAGRAPDPTDPHEVTLDADLADRFGVELGDSFGFTLLDPEQFSDFSEGFGAPAGAHMELRLVGLTRVASPEPGVEVLRATPAFGQRYRPDSVGQLARIRLRDGAGGVDAFQDRVHALGGRFDDPSSGEIEAFRTSDPSEAASVVRNTTHVQVLGLGIVALVVAAAGAVTVIQAMSRHVAADQGERDVERQLGMTAADLRRAGTLPRLLLAVTAAATTAGVAVATSWIVPVGSLRAIEPTPGWHPNVALLAAGAAVAFGVVWAAEVVLTARSARPSRRIAAHDARPSPSGWDATTSVGLFLASGARRSRSTLPIRSAVLGTAAGLAGISAALLVGTNLRELVTTPARYGWQGSFTVADAGQGTDAMRTTRRDLRASPAVEAIAQEASASVAVDGRTVDVSEIARVKGELGWSIFEGTAPGASGEVALGTRLARDIGAGVGDRVPLRASGAEAQRFLVTGIGLGPRDGEDPLGAQALVGPGGLRRIGVRPTAQNELVRLRPGVDVDRFVVDLEERVEVGPQAVPAEVSDLDQVQSLPRVVAALTAVVAVAALANVAATTARRRRRELAVLRAMGMTESEVRRSMLLGALLTTGKGVAIGLPTGTVLGVVVWRWIADASYVSPGVTVPVALLVLVPGALAIGLACSVLPAIAATRQQVAVDLRAE